MPKGIKGSKQKLICQHCRIEFYPQSGHLKAKFCSISCKNEFFKGKPVKSPPPKPARAKMTTSICIHCGSEFNHKLSSHPKYCECWHTRNPKVVHECVFCGSSFMDYKSNNKKYCSHQCYSNHLKILSKGENSHLWKGGTTKTSKIIRSRNDYKRWRKAVFERDNYTCVECGFKPNKSGILHAHHIESFANNEAKRLDVSNGATLCYDCHQKKHPQKLIRPKEYFDAGVRRFQEYKRQLTLF